MPNDIENWWEKQDEEDEEKVEAFAVPTPDPSRISITMWGDTGTIGSVYQIDEKMIDQTIIATFQALEKFKNADEWISLMRHANNTRNITRCIKSSEQLMYTSETSMKLINGYYATPINQLYFHIQRAYALADTGNFVSAYTIWNEIAESWLDCADEYRQPYILSQLYFVNLCSNRWTAALTHLDQLWSIIKFMDSNKRHAFGIWDEWTVCLLVSWIFAKHSTSFYEAFCQDFLGQGRLFEFQKKILIMEHLNPDFLASVIEEPYYNRARESNPELPEIHYKEKPHADL
jgi:hypothetical protein